MSEIMQFLQTIMTPLIVLFTVSNLAAMGIQARMPEVVTVFRNKKTLALILVWGWVVAPAVGYLIAWVLPLAEPFVVVVLLASLAPCAPFLPPLVEKCRGDMNFAGAFVPLTAAGTVVLMPLIAPLLIKGVTISTVALAKPLILTVLLPLVIAAAIRHYAGTVATRISPAVKGLGVLTSALTFILLIVLYWREMLDTAGSFALLAMTIFMVGIGLITYRFGFGLKQNQRSVMSLGMGTRNVAVIFAAALTIPNPDPRIITMIVMWVVWSVVLAVIAARIFAKQAGETVAGDKI